MGGKKGAAPALIIKLKALMPKVSKSEQRVLDFICQNPEKIIRFSISELAESCGVSDATVIRACRSAGASGYQELKVNLAQDIVLPIQNINEEISFDDDSRTIIEKVFQSTLNTLQYTRSTLDIGHLEKAVDCLLAADKIMIVGLGNSRSIALDLLHKFMRLGLNAVVYQDTHIDTIGASFLKPGNCLFAISHSGSTKDVVDCAKIAHEQGAKVITLSNIGKSPLLKYSDIPLHTASNETKYRIAAIDSRVAQVVLIDCIYTMIAIRKSDSVQGFNKIEKALHVKKY